MTQNADPHWTDPLKGVDFDEDDYAHWSSQCVPTPTNFLDDLQKAKQAGQIITNTDGNPQYHILQFADNYVHSPLRPDILALGRMIEDFANRYEARP